MGSGSHSSPPQEQLSVPNSLTSMGDIADPPTSPLGATDSTDDSDEDEDEDSEMDDWELRQPQSFNPHSLCEWMFFSHSCSGGFVFGIFDSASCCFLWPVRVRGV